MSIPWQRIDRSEPWKRIERRTPSPRHVSFVSSPESGYVRWEWEPQPDSMWREKERYTGAGDFTSWVADRVLTLFAGCAKERTEG